MYMHTLGICFSDMIMLFSRVMLSQHSPRLSLRWIHQRRYKCMLSCGIPDFMPSFHIIILLLYYYKQTIAATENTKQSKVETTPAPSQNKATTFLSILEESDGSDDSDGKLTKGTLSHSFRHRSVCKYNKLTSYHNIIA